MLGATHRVQTLDKNSRTHGGLWQGKLPGCRENRITEQQGGRASAQAGAPEAMAAGRSPSAPAPSMSGCRSMTRCARLSMLSTLLLIPGSAAWLLPAALPPPPPFAALPPPPPALPFLPPALPFFPFLPPMPQSSSESDSAAAFLLLVSAAAALAAAAAAPPPPLAFFALWASSAAPRAASRNCCFMPSSMAAATTHVPASTCACPLLLAVATALHLASRAVVSLRERMDGTWGARSHQAPAASASSTVASTCGVMREQGWSLVARAGGWPNGGGMGGRCWVPRFSCSSGTAGRASPPSAPPTRSTTAGDTKAESSAMPSWKCCARNCLGAGMPYCLACGGRRRGGGARGGELTEHPVRGCATQPTPGAQAVRT